MVEDKTKDGRDSTEHKPVEFRIGNEFFQYELPVKNKRILTNNIIADFSDELGEPKYSEKIMPHVPGLKNIEKYLASKGLDFKVNETSPEYIHKGSDQKIDVTITVTYRRNQVAKANETISELTSAAVKKQSDSLEGLAARLKFSPFELTATNDLQTFFSYVNLDKATTLVDYTKLNNVVSGELEFSSNDDEGLRKLVEPNVHYRIIFKQTESDKNTFIYDVSVLKKHLNNPSDSIYGYGRINKETNQK
jgi:hypothetical protein